MYAMAMTEGESLQDWGTRVMARVRLVNASVAQGAAEHVSRKQELEIFMNGIRRDGRFGSSMREVTPLFNMLPDEQHTVGVLMGRMQRVLDDRRDKELQAALRRAAAGIVEGEEEGGARGKGSPAAEGVGALRAGLKQLDPAVRGQALRILLEEEGMAEC